MKKLILFLAMSVWSWAAIPVDSVWQVQTLTSADTNCGGWSNANKGATGVDHSQLAGTTFTSTLSATGTTTLTDSAAGFLNTMLGNCINIAGQSTYFITGFTNTSTVTVDRNLGTFSTTSGHEGGPLFSLGAACLAMNIGGVDGEIAYFKNDGTFSITNNSQNVTGGVCLVSGETLLVGYQTNRTINNTDPPPTIQTNVNGATMFQNGFQILYNFILDGNARTGSAALLGGVWYINIQYKNFRANSGIGGSSGGHFNVSVTGSSAIVVYGNCYFCEFYGNTSTPFAMATGNGSCVFCLSYSNTGASTDGMTITEHSICLFCTTYANGRNGFNDNAGTTVSLLVNSYAESNVGVGFQMGGAGPPKYLMGFGYFGNGTNISGTPVAQLTSPITPASSAFISSTNLNTNATANAGALLRNVQFPVTFMRGLTPTYLDVNGTRHKDPIAGGGSSVVP